MNSFASFQDYVFIFSTRLSFSFFARLFKLLLTLDILFVFMTPVVAMKDRDLNQ